MFLLITAAIFGAIMFGTLLAIRFLFSGHLARKFYRLFTLADFEVASHEKHVLIGGR